MNASNSARQRSRLFAIFIGLNALAALGGAIALALGRSGLPRRAVERMPFESPVFAGIALLVIVGIPLGVLAFVAWRAMPSAPLVGRICGVLLVGWIGVQYLLLREFSPFQPFYGLLGLALVAWRPRAVPE